MLKMMLYLITLVVYVGQFCLAHDCENSMAEKCRKNVLQKMETEASLFSQTDKDDFCRVFHHNIPCLLNEFSLCENNDINEQTSNILHKGRDYMKKMCNQNKGWEGSVCFQSSHIEDCEDPALMPSLSADNCRKYMYYKECVTKKLKACPKEKLDLLGVFLVDKFGELVWQCPRVNQTKGMMDKPYAQKLSVPSQEEMACLSEVAEDLKGCTSKVEESSRMAEEKEGKEKIHFMCCMMKETEMCIRQVLQNKCSDFLENLMNKAMGQMLETMEMTCKDVDMDTCGSSSISPQGVLIGVLLLTIISFLKVTHAA
ncbi:uncharacterized protein LOC106464338 [Limulus polyphemus]|uniref:Uncharacterized protein LOC106464338 n=1 Tax=Limulus polyphemus TaxID=6850 RepID=A0ABM1BDS0_LIMPO|nr:uncharacterized protein LOC106464338 [Limulus polyphemus]